MKLIGFSPQPSKTEDTFNISATDGGYQIEKGGLTFNVANDFFKPCEVQFLTIGQRAIGIIPQSLYVDSRDWASVMRHNDFYRMFGAIYFGQTVDEAVLIISSGSFIEKGVDFLRQDYAPYAAAAATVCPSAAAVRKRNAAKIELIGKINPLDSLAAMEKQLDLLTMLVLTLATKQPSNEQPEWLPALTTIFDQTTSVDEASIEAAIKSLGSYKAHIRELQETYFKNRSTQ